MSTREVDGRSYRLASLGLRWLGQFLDALIYVALVMLPFFVLEVLRAPESVFLAGAIPAILYLLFQDGMEGGRSWGKRALGTRVVDAKTGRPCSWSQSFVRNITLILLNFFDWIFIFGERKQRLGDKLAETLVVYDP